MINFFLLLSAGVHGHRDDPVLSYCNSGITVGPASRDYFRHIGLFVFNLVFFFSGEFRI